MKKLVFQNSSYLPGTGSLLNVTVTVWSTGSNGTKDTLNLAPPVQKNYKMNLFRIQEFKNFKIFMIVNKP